MPYSNNYNNYSYVIDSSFKPFTMQEMLVPLTAYKNAYEEAEAAYNDLSKETDTFKYLEQVAKDNPDSKAAQIYKGYADELHRNAEDLSRNGLNMSNRRALTNLKRRYQGEIGRLVEANTALKQEMELRRRLGAQDTSLLYANDNLTIDDYLDNNTPNLYNISGNELYTRGIAAGKSDASRIYSVGDAGRTLGGYYRDWVERNGRSAEEMNRFRANAASIPELQKAAEDILAERGVLGNLTGANLERARQSVINGIIDGAIMQEKHNPVRDAGVLSASERDASARAWASHNLAAEQFELSKAINGITGNSRTGFTYDPARSIKVQEAIAKRGGTGSTGSGSGSGYHTINEKGVRMTWNGNNPEATNGEADTDYEVKPLSDEDGYSGRAYNFNDLPTYAQIQALAIIGSRSNKDNYIYYFRPYKGGFFDDTEAVLDIVPRKIVKDDDVDTEDDFGGLYGETQ